MTNDDLKKLLNSLYTNPSDFRNNCVKHLVINPKKNKRSYSTFDTLCTLADPGSFSVYNYILMLDKQYPSYSDNDTDNLKKEIEVIATNLKEVKSVDDFKKRVKEIANDDGIDENFINIFEHNCNEKDFYGFFASILASMLVYAVTVDNEKYDKTNLFATKILKGCLGTVEKNSFSKKTIELRKDTLDIIEKSYPDNLEEAKNLLNRYAMFAALAGTYNSIMFIRYKAKPSSNIIKDTDTLMYYENCEEKPLIANEDKDIPKDTTINEAIEKGCDYKNNSQYIAYGLNKIAEKIKEKYPDLQSTAKTIATEITYLILLNEINNSKKDAQIADEILFAFANPLIEFEHSIDVENFNNAITTSKQVAEDILGYELDFNKKEDDDSKSLDDLDKKDDDEEDLDDSAKKDDDDSKSLDDLDKKDDDEEDLDDSSKASDPDKSKKPTLSKIIEDLKSFVKPNNSTIVKLAFDEISMHGKFILNGLKNPTPPSYLKEDQKDLQGEVANKLLHSKTQKLIKNLLQTSNSFDFNKDDEIDNFIDLLIKCIKKMDFNKIDKLNKKIEDLNKSTKTEKERKQEYKNYKKEYNKILENTVKEAINDKVYRNISVFGDDYSDNYK